MNTERFIRQATRGLWGQKKRDVALELRGAIEDKIWRHQLRGLTPAEAEKAALRDLGNPHAVARDLHRVHTSPLVMRATLLLGVAGLLSLQAVAQGNAIRAAPDPNLSECAFTDWQLALLPPADAEATRAALRDPAERQRLIRDCLKRAPTPGNSLVRLTDLWSALRTSGVKVDQTSAVVYRLTFPGRASPALLNFDGRVQWIGGEKYVDLSLLVHQFIGRTDLPVTLSGTRNPTLSIGPTNLQLGTPTTPVLARDLYLWALIAAQAFPGVEELGFRQATLTDPTRMFHFTTQAPDDAAFAVTDNFMFVCACTPPGSPPRYLASVQTARAGQVPTTVPVQRGLSSPVVVRTMEDLRAATAANRPAILIRRIEGHNLRALTLFPVLTAQTKVVIPQ